MMSQRAIGAVWVVAAVFGVGAWAQGPVTGQISSKRPMTFADLMAMKQVSDPQISPSGKWVLFSVTDVSLVKNTKVNHLWVVPLDGSGPERQVTSNTGESFGRFSPDGKFVSYTGEATKDDPMARITIADWDEKTGSVDEGRELVGPNSDADGAVWSPDSKRLMFTAQVWPECSVKGGAADAKATTGASADANTGVLHFVQDDDIKGVVVGGTREVAAWKTAQPATWAAEDACDKAKDEAAGKSAVKGQVWEGLFYRHWDHLTGAKRTHILVIAANGDHVRDLTPASVVGDADVPTYMPGGGPLGYAWAPDSKEIAYVTNLDAVPAASTNNDVFTLRLDEVGAKAVKVSTSQGSDDGPAYSPDGKWLAWRSQEREGFESDKFRLVVMDRGTKTIKDVMPKLDRWVDEFVWAPNSRAVYLASGDAGQTLLTKVGVEVKPALAVDKAGVMSVRPTEEYGEVEVISTYHELSELAVSPDGSFLVASEMGINMPTEISSTDLRYLSIAGRSPAARSLLASSIRPPKPPTWRATYIELPKAWQKELDDRMSFSFSRKLPHTDGFHDPVTITHLNDVLVDQLTLLPLGSFKFVGAEGTPVQGFIVYPPNFDLTKKYPVKFLMHGGPQTAWGDSWSYRWNWELMAASGYVVIGINRRGSTGYGQKFVDEVSGDWGGRAYVDLMKGLDYAEAKFPFIDKTRECALGASYGGFMADWVLTHTDRFKCIVTHDGMFDPVSAYGSTEEMWFNEWEFRRPEDFPKGWDGFSGGYGPVGKTGKTNTGVLHSVQDDGIKGSGGLPGGHAAEPWRYASLAADVDPFRKWSPLRFIENAKTPTLVIHSQKDYRLDVSQGFELFTALQRRGVPSKMLYFPDEGHWVLKPQNSELWYTTVGDWCDRWTKTGKYAEATTAR